MISSQQIVQVLMDEYCYWRDQPAETEAAFLTQLGAMGAISNVVAALVADRPAPWHVSHPHRPVPAITRDVPTADPVRL